MLSVSVSLSASVSLENFFSSGMALLLRKIPQLTVKTFPIMQEGELKTIRVLLDYCAVTYKNRRKTLRVKSLSVVFNLTSQAEH